MNTIVRSLKHCYYGQLGIWIKVLFASSPSENLALRYIFIKTDMLVFHTPIK